MDKLKQLKDHLHFVCEYSRSEIDNMSPEEMVCSWLTYEGIIGYTGKIKRLFEAAYQIEL